MPDRRAHTVGVAVMGGLVSLISWDEGSTYCVQMRTRVAVVAVRFAERCQHAPGVRQGMARASTSAERAS